MLGVNDVDACIRAVAQILFGTVRVDPADIE
jgi:hypothetical protein